MLPVDGDHLPLHPWTDAGGVVRGIWVKELFFQRGTLC